MTAFKRGNWSSQELERLKLLFPRCSVVRISELLRRSAESVRRRAFDLFDGPKARGAWTDDDDQALRIGYGIHDLPELTLLLCRGERDVRERIHQLRGDCRRGAWSRAEETLFKQLYGSRSDADLEVCMSRSVGQIRRMARTLCLSKDKRFVAAESAVGLGRIPMPRWGSDEVRRLVTLYPHCENLEIARRLGRSVASVANKASQLRLKKSAKVLEEMGRRNVRARYRH